MPTAFTRPTDSNAKTYNPKRTTKPRKPMALISEGQSGKPQTRDIQATKREWTEEYPPMEDTASVLTFIENINTWANQGTDLDVVEKWGGTTITAVIKEWSEVQMIPPNFIVGLTIRFVEV